MSRMQDRINQPVAASYAGIDVSKDKLDFAIHDSTIFMPLPQRPRRWPKAGPPVQSSQCGTGGSRPANSIALFISFSMKQILQLQ